MPCFARRDRVRGRELWKVEVHPLWLVACTVVSVWASHPITSIDRLDRLMPIASGLDLRRVLV